MSHSKISGIPELQKQSLPRSRTQPSKSKVVTSKKYGRNDKIKISNGSETKELKWKKAKPLVDSGDWEIYVGGPIT